MKKFIAILSGVALLFAFGQAFAMEAEIDYNTNLVTFSDSAGEAKSALVLVRSKNSGAYVYSDLIFPAEGSFDTELKLPSTVDEGTYTLAFIKDNAEEEDTFAFVNVYDATRIDIANGLADILTSDAAAQQTKLNTWVTEYADKLNMDVAMYNSLESKQTFLELLDEMPHQSFVEIMAGLEGALQTAYNIQTMNIAIAEIKTASIGEITEILEATEEIFGIDLSETYYDYQAYVNERLQKTTELNLDNFSETFNRIMAIPYLNAADRDKIDGVIKEQDQYLHIYDQIHENKDALVVKILKRLEAVEFKELSEITDAIEEVVKEDKKGSSLGSSGGRGSGGSSSGGGTLSVQAPVVPIAPVTPSEPVVEPSFPEFTDISGFEWAQESIENLSRNGIISGREEGLFAPGENITRAEVAKILVLAFGFTAEEEVSFTDVASDSWYTPYIKKAVAAGVIVGKGDGTFAPEQFISRQDIAVMICRITDYIAESSELPFVDAHEVSDYAISAVSALHEKGVLNGMGDGRVAPLENLTRAECAKLIYEIIK